MGKIHVFAECPYCGKFILIYVTEEHLRTGTGAVVRCMQPNREEMKVEGCKRSFAFKTMIEIISYPLKDEKATKVSNVKEGG